MPAGKEYILGIDVGSVSANIVSIGPDREVAEEYYIRTYGKPFATIETFLSTYTQRAANLRIKGVAFTGTAGQFIAQGTGCHCENEIIGQTRAVSHLEPQVRTVIEMGGQDAKMIFLEPTAASAKLRIKDFSMNALCAAGTGSFLDQQASRLGLSIEDFSRLADGSTHPPRIAGRCSVFAKSDMIHLPSSEQNRFGRKAIFSLCQFLKATGFQGILHVAVWSRYSAPV